MFCFALLLIVIWNKALTSHNQLNIQNIAQKLPVLLYFTCIYPNTTLRAQFNCSRVLVIIRQVREVWWVHVHHYYCQEKLDNIHPGGLALGHRSTGTIRSQQSEHYNALVAEECFNFWQTTEVRDIGHPRRDHLNAWPHFSLNFESTLSCGHCSLAFPSFSQDL